MTVNWGVSSRLADAPVNLSKSLVDTSVNLRISDVALVVVLFKSHIKN